MAVTSYHDRDRERLISELKDYADNKDDTLQTAIDNLQTQIDALEARTETLESFHE